MGHGKTAHGPRHSDPAVRRAAGDISEHVGRCGGRGDLAEVNDFAGPVRTHEKQVASAADVAGSRMRYGEREGRRHGTVDGVATLLQNCEPDVRGRSADADNHTLATANGLRIAG